MFPLPLCCCKLIKFQQPVFEDSKSYLYYYAIRNFRKLLLPFLRDTTCNQFPFSYFSPICVRLMSINIDTTQFFLTPKAPNKINLSA